MDLFGQEIPTDKTEEGKYHIPLRGVIYEVLMSRLFGWEHFSVTVIVPKKGFFPSSSIPNPDEVEMLKEMFFKEDETTIEVHPKKEDYVNINPYVLHLWRRYDMILPTPPRHAAFTECDLLDLDNPNLKLLIKESSQEDWKGYEVSILKNGKPLKRQPSWDEMCIAKKHLCGLDEVAIEFHFPDRPKQTYSRTIWMPPKTVDFPLPDAFLVGIRNTEDQKKLWLKSLTYKEGQPK